MISAVNEMFRCGWLRFGVITLLFLAAAPAFSQDPATVLALPRDPKAAVITMDFHGGLGPRRVADTPILTIHADGGVVIVDPAGTASPFTSKITVDQLEDLLRFAIIDHHFGQFNAKTVQDEVTAEAGQAQMRMRVSDATTTLITIRTAGFSCTDEYYALSEYARIYPNVKALADLYAVQKRLSDLMSAIRAKK